MKMWACILSGLAAASLLLSACAGRDPNPVEMTKATDTILSCPLIRAEMEGNTSRARTLLKAAEDADSNNAALVVTGIILFPPLMFLMDLSEADKIELEALQNRNTYLAKVASDKDCGFDFPPTLEEADRRERMKRIKEAETTGATPKCADVGGYEAYMQDTGRVCEI